jgi:hypothetical protein
MKSKYQTILDKATNTGYILASKQSAQHGTVVIYHFKKADIGSGAERIQLSEEYLKELIERGVIEWI